MEKKKSKTRQLSGVVSPPPSPPLARRTDHSARPSSGPPGESTPRRDCGSMVVSRRSACWAAFCRAARMGSVCARIIASSSSSSCELHPIISQSITARISQQLRPAPRLADGDARSLCFYTVKMLFRQKRSQSRTVHVQVKMKYAPECVVFVYK